MKHSVGKDETVLPKDPRKIIHENDAKIRPAYRLTCYTLLTMSRDLIGTILNLVPRVLFQNEVGLSSSSQCGEVTQDETTSHLSRFSVDP